MEIHTTIRVRTGKALIPARDLPDLLAGPMPAPARTPENPQPPEADVAAWSKRAVAWHHARKKFANKLRNALASGKLRVHDPETHLIAEWGDCLAEAEWRLGYQLVARDALEAFMREEGIRIEIELVEDPGVPLAEPAVTWPEGWGTAGSAVGVPRKQILDTPWPFNPRKTFNLARALSDPPGWLKGARLYAGNAAPGHSSTWDPAAIAYELLNRGYAAKHALAKHLEAHYPDWLDGWHDLTRPDS